MLLNLRVKKVKYAYTKSHQKGLFIGELGTYINNIEDGKVIRYLDFEMNKQNPVLYPMEFNYEKGMWIIWED